MKRLYAVLFALLLVTAGCEAKSNLNIESDTDQHIETTTAPNKMPKDMPSTFNFMVRFGIGTVNKNEINTFQGTVTKDLIENGTASAKIKFTKEELSSIYLKMRDINIMAIQNLSPAVSGCERVPFSEDMWEISINGETNTFTWTDKHCNLTEEAEQVLELRKFIQDIVEEKPEYIKLPEAEGGYQ